MFCLWVWQRPHLCTRRRESIVLQRQWSGEIYYNNGTDSSRGVAILFTPRFHYMLFNSLEPDLSPTYYNILGGDFNCIVHPDLDKQGANPAPRQSALQLLNSVMAQFNLIDIWCNRNPHTHEFTWTGRDTRTMNSFICTRIDRFYTSQTISPYILHSTILAYPHSDHDLISLSLDLNHQLPYVN